MLRDIKNKLVIKTNTDYIQNYGVPYFDDKCEWLTIRNYKNNYNGDTTYRTIKLDPIRDNFKNNVDLELFPVSSTSFNFSFRWNFLLADTLYTSSELNKGYVEICIHMRKMFETLFTDRWNDFKKELGIDPFGDDSHDWSSVGIGSATAQLISSNNFFFHKSVICSCHGDNPNILYYTLRGYESGLENTKNVYIWGSMLFMLRNRLIPNYIVYSTEKKLRSFYLKAKRFLYNLVQKLTYFNYLPSNI